MTVSQGGDKLASNYSFRRLDLSRGIGFDSLPEDFRAQECVNPAYSRERKIYKVEADQTDHDIVVCS